MYYELTDRAAISRPIVRYSPDCYGKIRDAIKLRAAFFCEQKAGKEYNQNKRLNRLEKLAKALARKIRKNPDGTISFDKQDLTKYSDGDISAVLSGAKVVFDVGGTPINVFMSFQYGSLDPNNGYLLPKRIRLDAGSRRGQVYRV